MNAPPGVTISANDAELSSGARVHFIEAIKTGADPLKTPAIVCVHGWPDFSFGWRHQLPVFALKGYRVIAPDLRGFGQSAIRKEVPDSPDAYSMRRHTADMAALLDYLHISSAVFIGHDWGSRVVWTMARRYPHCVRAVVSLVVGFSQRSLFYVPVPLITWWYPNLYYWSYFNEEHGARATRELEADPQRFFTCLLRTSRAQDQVGRWMDRSSTSLLEHYPAAPARSDLLSADELQAYVNQYTQSGFARSLRMYAHETFYANWWDERELPQTVEQPTLLVNATRDHVIPPSFTEGLENYVPHLTRVRVEAGHWVQVEQREQVNAHIAAFLDQLDNKAPAGH